ncbi:hypothetical protein C1O66_04460 [Paucibacter aquatile]|jgi:hypothetical protein|uniref:Uncharacterized protein n=1 Tax=Kinneretia aquatilis TaxID=2070761 RepID=A0A2N8KTX2_9BURK|nr:hypothetical protein [Paucibacter aquatile]PND36862.1 hypothetical protein C1O66_04460 [Paucibacter aquatile]WIW00016.1 hypothetical protein K9V56_011320 [Paucibacter aquatile]
MRIQHTLVALAALLSLPSAQAGWDPVVTGGQYIVTVEYGGGSVSVSEGRNQYGPLARTAGELRAIPFQMENGLNSFMRSYASSNGVNFQRGSLSGDLRLQISPQGNGLMRTTLSGVSYNAWTQFSGKKWGIIRFNCVSHLSLANISVGASYNVSNGQVPSSSIMLDGQPNSSTDCDSNLSWILPVVGNFIIRKVEGQIDQAVLQGLQGTLGQGNQALFYGRDNLQLTGLTRLISADRQVTLPNGQQFPIGQYVHNNLAYLLGNAQVTVQLGKGAIVPDTHWGGGEPGYYQVQGDHLNLQISVPGLSFSVRLHEQVQLEWNWNGRCGPNSDMTCHIP